MLKGKTLENAYIKNKVKALNLDLNDSYTVVKITPHKHDELRDEQISRQLENINGCKPVFHENAIVAIFPKIRRQQTSLIDKLKKLSHSISGNIGVSDELAGFNNLHLLYLQASIACDFGQRQAHSTTVFHYANVVSWHPFIGFSDLKHLDAMYHPGLRILKAYDLEYNTPFIETLETYLNNERHSLPTAAALHIHRNTLTYRLEKINALYPFNLDDANERYRMLMTFQIFDFMKKTSSK